MELGYIQVEVTSKCGMNCLMCPTRVEEWEGGDMDFNLFKRVSESFSNAGLIHLQGWGEPILHPDFEKIVKIAAKHAAVSFTTNGYFLDRISDETLELCDFVVISIAGASEETHRKIRKGSLKALTENARRVSRLTNLKLSYMLTKTNIHELTNAVELAANLNADFFATNLDYVFDETSDELRVFSKPGMEGFVEKAKEKAKELGVKTNFPPLEPGEVLVCAENPVENVVISSDGLVFPCVYLALHLNPIPRFFNGKMYYIERRSFGDLNIESLDDVWDKESYRTFRETFKKRLWDLERIAIWPGTQLRIPQLPETCRTCYKAYGL